MRSGRGGGWRAHGRGFTYLVALFLVATLGALAALGATGYATEARRQKERELLRIGALFRGAIEAYYRSSPGTVPRYPASLEDLLEDRRYLSLRRYLRRIERDPVTGRTEWGLVQAPDGGIMGVHSLSDRTPLKQTGFARRDAAFTGAQRYRDWVFVFPPPAPGAAPSGGASR